MSSFIFATWLLAGSAALSPLAAVGGIARREIVVPSGDARIAATLLLPDVDERVPAVVIIHGSGTSDRANAWTTAYADALAARGIAVLHPDKRGCGKSTGNWKSAGFDRLADDAQRLLEWLREQPKIDATNVGLIGFSQGVDIAPVCAARPDGADFVIAVSGSTVPLLDQIVHEIDLGAAHAGAPLSAEQLHLVATLHRRALTFALDGQGWDDLQAGLAQATAAGGTLSEAVSGIPRTREHWLWGWMRAVGDFDPMPFWQQVDAPMLFIYGGSDTQVKASESIERLRRTFAGSDRNWCVLELARNGHALFREDVLDFAARWIRDRGAP